jgi:hypothetical protein
MVRRILLFEFVLRLLRARWISALGSACSQMSAQAGNVDHAGGEKGDDKHLVHRGLRESLLESLAKHERDSGSESQRLFFPGFISRLQNAARFSAATYTGAACSA